MQICPSRGGSLLDVAQEVELLYFDGCPSHEAVLRSLRWALDRTGITVDVERRRVISFEDAERERFLGSPTIRIDGNGAMRRHLGGDI